MKKLLSFALAFVLLLSPFTAARGEEEKEVFTCGDFQYALLEDGTAEIRKYTGDAESLAIPDTLDGHPVTSIGDYAFSNCSNLTSVTIPDSVTSIGDYAFWRCPALSSIVIPGSVTAIEDYAFSLCDSLTSVTIPDSVISIGANPFRYCNALTTIIVSPDHPALAIIDGVLFSKADKRLVCYPTALAEASYAIPQGIACIGDYAFGNCDNLTEIIVPDSVTAIGDGTFYGLFL